MSRTAAERPELSIAFLHKERESPDTLYRMCLDVVARNWDALRPESADGYALPEKTPRIARVCEDLLEALVGRPAQHIDSVVGPFGDVARARLERVIVSGPRFRDDHLERLLRHDPRDLALFACENLTADSYRNVLGRARNLRSLTVVGPSQMFSDCMRPRDPLPARIDATAPNLETLTVRRFSASAQRPGTPRVFLERALQTLPQRLGVLDLSWCSGFDSLQFLNRLRCLHTLNLSGVRNMQNIGAVYNICTLKSLVTLDLSQIDPVNGFYPDASRTLDLIARSLVILECLDISGTNLDGIVDAPNASGEPTFGTTSDIPGLECRVHNPLELLGLYRTAHEGCRRRNIPAKIVCGHADEGQLFNAAAMQIKNRDILIWIIKDFKDLLSNGRCTRYNEAIDVILEVLARYGNDERFQLNATEGIFHFIQNQEHHSLLDDKTVTQRIIGALLTGMEYHVQQETVMRQCFITLRLFKLPQVVMFQYHRFLKMLLHFLSMEYDIFHRDFNAINFLYSITQKPDYKLKNELGDMGVIQTMLMIIKRLYLQRSSDINLRRVWSIIWYVTDQSPTNCKRFLDENGMQYFLECHEAFPDELNLMRIMMGLLGNIAEVEELRPRLMEEAYVKIFFEYLNSRLPGYARVEINCHVAGIIVHLASDGPEAWTITEPSRHEVLKCLTNVMQRWDSGSNRNVVYHSLKPLLKLAKVSHTGHCAYWAVWVISNLSINDPKKYCRMVVAEGGLKIMKEVINKKFNHRRKGNHFFRLKFTPAQTVIDWCKKYVINSR